MAKNCHLRKVNEVNKICSVETRSEKLLNIVGFIDDQKIRLSFDCVTASIMSLKA